MSSDIESDVTDPGDEFQIIEQHDFNVGNLFEGTARCTVTFMLNLWMASKLISENV